jgi:hypothetical protein
MKLYRNEYQHSDVLLEQLEDLKANLINCPPKALKDKLQQAQAKYFGNPATKILAVMGRKPSKPTVVKALNDLYWTHDYEQPVAKPKDAWQAAQAFVDYRNKMINPHPGTPVVCKPPSRSSTLASSDSGSQDNGLKPAKALRWAEVLEEVRLID